MTACAGDTLGYARVSTNDQNLDAQRARLIEAGAIRVFTDIVAVKRSERPASPNSSITPDPVESTKNRVAIVRKQVFSHSS